MSVGRLPRDQRNIGGTRPQRPPSTRSLAAAAAAAAAPARKALRHPTATPITHPAVIPKATLHHPGMDLSPDSHVMFVVDVTHQVDLADVPVSIRQRTRDITGQWHPATWQDTKANTGTAMSQPQPIIRVDPRGRSEVHVDVRLPTAAGVHILNAGRFIAQ